MFSVSEGLILPDTIRQVGIEKAIERLRNPELRYISVNDGFSLDDFDFSPLSSRERIESLSFFSMRGRLSSIDKILRHIRRLDSLFITTASPIDNHTVRSIASINGLTQFWLENPTNNMNGVDLSPLGDCESLRSMKIETARLQSIDLTFVRSLRQLTSLSLKYNRLRSVDLSPLSDCGRLKELELSQNGFDEGMSLEPLSQCTSLEELGLGRTHLTEIDLSPLAGGGLVTLNLPIGRIGAIDLSPLAKCRSLRNISLARQRFRKIDLSALAACRNLRVLLLQGNRLSSIDLFPLGDCTELETLDFGYNRLKSIDLSPLSSCSSLQKLYLRENRLTTVDLSPLSACPNIKLVDLRENLLGKVDTSPVRTAEVRLVTPSSFLDTTKPIIRVSTGESETDIPGGIDTIITEREDDDEDE